MTYLPSDASKTGKPKILVLYVHTGGGHLSAARAIEAAINSRYAGRYEVVILNVSSACNSKQVSMMYESYNLMLKADPRYAKHGLRFLNAVNLEKVVLPLLRRAHQNVLRTIQREQPDLIVSVHAILNHTIIGVLKTLDLYGKVPYIIVCTDLTDNFLKGWANPEATKIITFTEMAKRQMLDFGVPAEKVVVNSGFMVNPSFFEDKTTRAEARELLGLDPKVFTVLISMGGMAIPRKTRAVVRALINSHLPLQLLVICGMNGPLKRQMHYMVRKCPLRIHVHGFTQRVGLMMTASDLMISKPGPGTIMESVIKGLPLLLDNVTEPMPQEIGNLEYAVAQGIAQKFTSYRQLPRIIDQLMQDRPVYEKMQMNMRRIKNEQAIFEVAETILAELPVTMREHELIHG